MSESKKVKDVLTTLRGLTIDDLLVKSKTLEEDVFGLQLKKRTGQLKTTADIKTAKRILARANTLISEKKAQEKK